MEKEDRLNSISSKQTERSQASDILQQGKWRLNDVKINIKEILYLLIPFLVLVLVLWVAEGGSWSVLA